jgi:hypothetical protein
MSKADRPLAESVQRQLSFFQTLRAVLWAMFGVRKGAGLRNDIAKLNPVHVILTGLLFGVFFVVSLIMLARLIVSNMTG